jgi:uncharacterized protein YecE (DUF72 family)
VVPDNFRFIIKASRRITHHGKLEDVEESVTYLAERVERLEHKLGAVLLQLPPYLRKGHERLAKFLDAWPRSIPAAIEFRHDSWFDDETFDLLAEHGVALGVSEDGALPMPARIATTDWLYLRLRKPGYSPQALRGWLTRTGNTQAERGFAFFKHEDAGSGPVLAERFLAAATRQRGPAAPRRAARRPAADGETTRRSKGAGKHPV